MNIQEITSSQNKFIKLAKSLNTSKGRKNSGLFLIEGQKILKEALKRDIKIEYIFIADTDFEHSFENIDIDSYKQKEDIQKITINKTPDRIMKQISTTDTPCRVVAIAKQINKNTQEKNQSNKPKLDIYCEEIQDPGNLGAIIRSAFAAGVDSIYLSQACADIYNPKTIRSSMGAIFAGDIFFDTGIISEGNSPSIKLSLNKNTCNSNKESIELSNYQIIGSSSHTELEYKDFKSESNKNILLMIGNEGKGLSQESLNLCTHIVKIPMHNDIESLNALAATSVLLFELNRKLIS